MAKVMVNLTGLSSRPTLAQVQAQYGLAAGDLDDQFGVIEVDPQEGVYTVLVDEQAASRLTGQAFEPRPTAYSNPPIEPFGPPEP